MTQRVWLSLACHCFQKYDIIRPHPDWHTVISASFLQILPRAVLLGRTRSTLLNYLIDRKIDVHKKYSKHIVGHDAYHMNLNVAFFTLKFNLNSMPLVWQYTVYEKRYIVTICTQYTHRLLLKFLHAVLPISLYHGWYCRIQLLNCFHQILQPFTVTEIKSLAIVKTYLHRIHMTHRYVDVNSNEISECR